VCVSNVLIFNSITCSQFMCIHPGKMSSSLFIWIWFNYSLLSFWQVSCDGGSVFCLFQQTAFILHFMSEFCFLIVVKIIDCFIVQSIKKVIKIKKSQCWFVLPSSLIVLNCTHLLIIEVLNWLWFHNSHCLHSTSLNVCGYHISFAFFKL